LFHKLRGEKKAQDRKKVNNASRLISANIFIEKRFYVPVLFIWWSFCYAGNYEFDKKAFVVLSMQKKVTFRRLRLWKEKQTLNKGLFLLKEKLHSEFVVII